MQGLDDSMKAWFRENLDRVRALAEDIFAHPETAYEETHSSQAMKQFLEEQGFDTSAAVPDMPTAFIAKWSQGTGKPVLGFLAEYDALPDLEQEPVPEKCGNGGPGHGCGHNLLGTGDAAAACALKAYMEAHGLDGTVILYGCPAEETMSGKIVMNRMGLFDRLDCAITWHPFDRNRVSYDKWLAIDTKIFRFHGKAAHAAMSPEKGRSALDAAELMNVGVNYLREHVADDVRMHYVYTAAGEQANIVPDYAETHYFIRSGLRARTEDASERVDNCAKGAALMTGTTVDIELVGSCSETKLNRTLSETFFQAMQEIPLPEYTEEEIDFVRQLTKNAGLENSHADDPGRYADGYFPELTPLEDEPPILSIGTDVSDVSHRVPTVTVSAAAFCTGTALHSWAAAAQAGNSTGRKGMLYAAESMALGAAKLLEDPSILEKAQKEFHENP